MVIISKIELILYRECVKIFHIYEEFMPNHASKIKDPQAFIETLFAMVERSQNSIDLKLVGEYVKREYERIQREDDYPPCPTRVEVTVEHE